MALFNFEINLIPAWLSTCVRTNSIGAGRFSINHTKPYLPFKTLSTQNNPNLPEKLKWLLNNN